MRFNLSGCLTGTESRNSVKKSLTSGQQLFGRKMKVSRMTRRRSESISSSSSMSSRSNGTAVSLHQAKSLDSLDQSESTSSSADSTDRLQLAAWKRQNYETLGHHQSTMSSCESGEGSSSSYWSRSDGRSSSSQSLSTADSESSSSVRPSGGYRQLQSTHPKQQQRTGSDCKMLAMFSCCLDRRHQSSTSSSSSRWTDTPDYGKLNDAYSSASISLESSSTNDLGGHSSHRTGSASRLIVKVPNQR